MVVVAIVGIFVGVAMFSTDLVNFDRKLERETARLATRIRFTSEEALMQNRDFGIVFFQEGYEFRQFLNGQGWETAEGVGMESFRLEDDMGMQIMLGGQEIVLENYCEIFPCGAQLVTMDEDEQNALIPDPHVILFSSGEVTPFSIEFFRVSEEFTSEGFRLSVEFDGETEIARDEL